MDDSSAFGPLVSPVVHLAFGSQGMTGTFPMEVILLKETLTWLFIDDNPISNFGLENLWWLGELTHLERLGLSGSGFGYDQGLPLDLGFLTNLKRLRLVNSDFTGSLDATSIFQNMSHLERLVLSGLNLTQANTLFAVLPSLSQLTSLTLRDIPLQANLSFRLSDLPNLQSLNIRKAHLTGNLDVLFATDDLPESFSSTLNTLILSNHPNLSGGQPRTIGRFSLLRSLDLRNCGLSGQLPSELALLDELQYVEFRNNAFTGTIPSHLGKHVTSLALQNNNLTGGLNPLFDRDSALGDSNELKNLNLSNNAFLGGTIPTTVSLFPKLVDLELENCGLTGPIPTQIGLLRALRSMPLNDNLLNGTIPTELGDLLVLQHVQLHNNDLNGPLPDTLCRQWDVREEPVLSFTLDCSTLLLENATMTSCEEANSCCTLCY